MRYFEIILFIAVGTLFLLMTGCAASNSTSTKNTEYSNKISSSQQLDLEYHLRRLSGVRVIGSGNNLQVTIRGKTSINNPNQQPLYIINGQQAGRSFSTVNQMISKGSITSVKVIPSSRASQYGMQGSAGVIEIETK